MRKVNKCRVCGNQELITLKEFGELPVAGLYYNEEDMNKVVKLPMTVVFCDHCGHVQLKEIVDGIIYKDYSYTGTFSAEYTRHLDWVAEYLLKNYSVSSKSIVEVGSSNGYLLYKLRKIGKNQVFGYEPSKKLTDYAFESMKVESSNNYFSKDVINECPFKNVDVIVIRHVLEHIDDFNAIFDGINSIICEDGLLLIEVPSLEKTIQDKIYSNFFHEHLNYFSEKSIVDLVNSYGFNLLEKKGVNIHGGSTFLIFKKSHKMDNNFINISTVKLDEIKDFIKQMDDYYQKINNLIICEKNKGRKICGYGASHRTTMILSMLGVNNKIIDKIYDENTFLHGKYIPCANIKIDSPDKIELDTPDEMILFAISFEDEIRKIIKEKYGDSIKLVSLKGEPHLI